MPVRTPCPLSPSAAERVRLKKIAYGHKAGHRLRVRAPAVLHAARGLSNVCIGREAGLHRDTVRRWRGRFAPAGPPGLEDRQRCGLPPRSHRCRPPRSRCWPAGCLPKELVRLSVPTGGCVVRADRRPAGSRPARPAAPSARGVTAPWRKSDMCDPLNDVGGGRRIQ
ncbi:helix-turn-helix domain-containing protein [Streptomyces sp. NPDC054804]